MKTKISIVFSILFSGLTAISANNNLKDNVNSLKSNCRFTENKGQIMDQHYMPRPDVLFSGSNGTTNYFIKSNGISYQFNQYIAFDKNEDADNNKKSFDSLIIYRLDINWMGVNTFSQVEKISPSFDYTNFYNVPQGTAPVLYVRDYESICIKNIYNNIDLKYYSESGNLKYDYIVKPGADYRSIKFEIKGAENISITKRGSVIIKTPYGAIEEQAPYVYQGDKVISSKWQLNGNILSFELGKFDASKELIIDPIIRAWGTYYGGNNSGSNFDIINALSTDASSNIYAVGTTTSTNNIATSGSHQSGFGGGSGINDAFMVKFNSAGVRQWATYYGGNGYDVAKHCTIDNSNNIYMVGYTGSSFNIASASGVHQSSISLNDDGFIAKFDLNGVREWGTYYGGNGIDVLNGCAFDGTNLIVCGQTNSSSSMATLNSSSGGNEAILAKFSPSGNRLWGRYLGGNMDETAYSCTVDASGNIYMAGSATSASGISTSGAHQTSLQGTVDGFLAKFSTHGVPDWVTYYGGSDLDVIEACGVDNSGNIYISGRTNSSNDIATSGTYQSTIAGNFDGFLAKFNASGVRQWGTYFGGTGIDRMNKFTFDISYNLILSGYTTSNSGISTSGTHQTSFGGGADGFIVSFNQNGSLNWASYYGGSGNNDEAFCTAFDSNGNIYLAGQTNSTNGQSIATTGAHQTTYGGGNVDGFLVQFCMLPTQPAAINGNIQVCAGTSQTYTVNPVPGATSYTWNLPSGWSGTSTTNSITYTVGNTVGQFNISVFASNACGVSSSQNLLVDVNAVPAQPSAITGAVDLCAGSTQTYQISSVAGATSYTWNLPVGWTGSSSTETINANVGTSNGNFTISVVANNACGNSTAQTLNVSVASAAPAQPGTITGNNTVCTGTNQNYSIAAVNEAASYIWTLPSGWSGSSSSNSINAVVGTSVGSEIISVAAQNACGTSSVQTVTITVNTLPNQPGAISGNTSFCSGSAQVFSIANVAGADSYTWNLPSGWSGSSSSNTINATVGSNIGTQTVSVTANNSCGSSTAQTLSVNVNNCATGIDVNTDNFETIFFPNPATIQFTIANAEIGTRISVIDITGKVMFTETVNANTHVISTKDLVSGIYFVQLENNGQISQMKLVVNK
jgi:hypothetical protein